MSSTQSPEPASVSPPSASGNSDPPDALVSARVRNIIALAITVVWAIGIVADAIAESFVLSPFVYGTMTALVAAIFGSNIVKGIKQ